MKKKLLEMKRIIDEMLEIESTKIKLEPKNLKINSDGWKKHTNHYGQKYLENPTGDVWEYEGNQYFTWDGAMREVKKLGKKLPTDDEMELLTKEDYGDIEYTGYRTNGSFYYLGTSEDFWSSTESGSPVWIRNFCLSNSTVNRNTHDKENGFSVRCVKE